MALDFGEDLRSSAGSSQYYILIQSINSYADPGVPSSNFVISEKLNVEVVENLDSCATLNDFNFTVDNITAS